MALLIKDEKHSPIREDQKEIQMFFFLTLTGWFHSHTVYHCVGTGQLEAGQLLLPSMQTLHKSQSGEFA